MTHWNLLDAAATLSRQLPLVFPIDAAGTAPAEWTLRLAHNKAFIEMVPGGDPQLAWGVFDLNCMRVVRSTTL